MADIKYTIEFLSDWHCGSGLAKGADVDALVVKDKNKLPYVPGKTIKGLVRESVEIISQFQGDYKSDDKIKDAFGFFQGSSMLGQGNMFFRNATLSVERQKEIINHNLSEFLYRTIASTAIEENGIAKEHSLRKIEVVIPCCVEGEILDVPDDLKDLICKGLKMIKRLGQNRNRGLGRCQITIND